MKRGLLVVLWLSSLSAHAGWFNFGSEAKPAPAKKNPEVAMQTSNPQNMSTTADAQPTHSTVLRVAPRFPPDENGHRRALELCSKGPSDGQFFGKRVWRGQMVAT